MLLRITCIFLIILIAYLSVTPAETVMIGNDKISHFLAYGALTFNATLMVFPARNKMISWTLMAMAYGASIEVVQHFVPGRVMSIYDFYADLGGALVGLLLTLFFGKWVIQILKATKLI